MLNTSADAAILLRTWYLNEVGVGIGSSLSSGSFSAYTTSGRCQWLTGKREYGVQTCARAA